MNLTHRVLFLPGLAVGNILTTKYVIIVNSLIAGCNDAIAGRYVTIFPLFEQALLWGSILQDFDPR